MPVVTRPEAKRFEIPFERLNIPADRLQKEMEWIEEADIPPQIRNAIAATIWLLLAEEFRNWEESMMLEGKYETSLEDHRATLSRIIAYGEQVVFAASKEGMFSTRAGFSVEDLRATLNSLHTTFRCQHGPHNPPKTGELIDQLLNGDKPKD